MEELPQKPPTDAPRERRLDPELSQLSNFLLALREGLAGMPEPGQEPEAGELRAQIERLEGLARRLAVKEAELEEQRGRIEDRWKRFTQEILPKLTRGLTRYGLEGLFDFHGALTDVPKSLAEPPREEPGRAQEKAAQAYEMLRLQKEVLRLLQGRRLRRILKDRCAQLEKELERHQALLREAHEEQLRLKAELGKSWIAAEAQGPAGAEASLRAQAGKAWAEAQAQSTEAKRLNARLEHATQERDRHKAELEKFRLASQFVQNESMRLEAELELARKSAQASAGEAERLRAEVQSLAEERARLQARQERGEARPAAEAQKRILESENRRLAQDRLRLEAELRKARESSGTLAGEAARLEGDLREARRAAQAAEGESEVHQSELRKSVAERNRLEAELKGALQEAQARAREAQNLEGEFRTLYETRVRLEARLREAQAASQSAEEETRLLQAMLRKAAEERARLEGELGKAQQAQQADAGRTGRLEGELRRAAEESAGLESELEKARQEAGNLRKEAGRLESEIKNFSEERARLLSERQAALDQTRSLKSQLEAFRAELQKSAEERARLSSELARVSRKPGLEPSPETGVGRAFETLLPSLAGIVGQLRQLAARGTEGSPTALSEMLFTLARHQDQLRALAELHAPPPALSHHVLGPLVEAELKAWESALRQRGIALTPWLPMGLPACLLHAERLRVALHALLSNAYEAMPQGGNLTVRLAEDSAAGKVLLSFEDTGPGFPPEILAEPFRPYRSARAPHLGIGLALAHRVMQGFGGRMEVSNAEKGARVTLAFEAPRVGPPPLSGA